LYSASNILETYVSCDECNKLCYRLTDCTDSELVYYTEEDYSAYVGRVIQYVVDDVTYCATVDTYICRNETYPLFPHTVLDCFKTCDDCYPPPPEPEPPFELNQRTVKPGYDTPACTPAYWDKVKCKFSEALYQHMASIRYGIEFCCNNDMEKWIIKNELLDLAAITDPDICNQTCEESQLECTAGEPQCLSNGFYNIDLTITYPEDFTEGNLIVNGQSFAIEGSPQVVTLQLLGNGAPVDISLSFSDYDATQEFSDVFTAPVCELEYVIYEIYVPTATPSIQIFYKNQNGTTSTISTPFTKSDTTFVIQCVEKGWLFDGVDSFYEIDGTCQSPDGTPCVSTGAIQITQIGIC
jgi:hypothetical protein